MERSEYKMVFVILTWTRQARVRRVGWLMCADAADGASMHSTTDIKTIFNHTGEKNVCYYM